MNLGKGEDGNSRGRLLSDATVSTVERIDVGVFSSIFGGGIARTSTNLVAGPPGVGKTTLFLMIAAHLVSFYPDNREILWIASEQKDDEIKTTALRLKLEYALPRIRVIDWMGGAKEPIENVVEEINPMITILDSLSELTRDYMLQATILENLRDAGKRIRSPALVVNQINKAGDFLGVEGLQHKVDATFRFQDEIAFRYIFSDKNRFGGSYQGLCLRMTDPEEEIPGMLVVMDCEMCETRKATHVYKKGQELTLPMCGPCMLEVAKKDTERQKEKLR